MCKKWFINVSEEPNARGITLKQILMWCQVVLCVYSWKSWNTSNSKSIPNQDLFQVRSSISLMKSCRGEYKLRTDARFTTFDTGKRVLSPGCRMQILGCGLQNAGCRMCVAGCRFWDVGCKMQVAGCVLQDADCRWSLNWRGPKYICDITILCDFWSDTSTFRVKYR